MNRKWIIIIGVVALLLVGGIILLLSEGEDGQTALEELIPGPFGGPSRSGEGGFLTESQVQKLMLSGDPAADYEVYRTYARYPHESRPLDAKMKDLLDPWQVAPVRLPIITNPVFATENSFKAYLEAKQKEGKSPEEIEAEIKETLKKGPAYQFAANRHTLTPGDELIVTLAVTSADDNQVSVNITEALIRGDENFGRLSLRSIDFNDRGVGADKTADDKIYTASWKLPSADKKYWGNLDLLVKARVEGINEDVTLHHHFYSSPVTPAVFTNQFSERLENGSLVIDQIVDVKVECRFTIQANLFNVEEDVPTHWVNVQKVLAPGKQTVSYLFFGKIFRDGGYEGKFRIQNLRGTCENLPFPARWLGDPSKMDQIVNAEPLKEPLLHYMPFTNLTFTTAAYTAANFSDQEWESEEKTTRLEYLKAAMSNQ